MDYYEIFDHDSFSFYTNLISLFKLNLPDDPEKGCKFSRPFAIFLLFLSNLLYEIFGTHEHHLLENILQKYEKKKSGQFMYRILRKWKLLTERNKQRNFPNAISVTQWLLTENFWNYCSIIFGILVSKSKKFIQITTSLSYTFGVSKEGSWYLKIRGLNKN